MEMGAMMRMQRARRGHRVKSIGSSFGVRNRGHGGGGDGGTRRGARGMRFFFFDCCSRFLPSFVSFTVDLHLRGRSGCDHHRGRLSGPFTCSSGRRSGKRCRWASPLLPGLLVVVVRVFLLAVLFSCCCGGHFTTVIRITWGRFLLRFSHARFFRVLARWDRRGGGGGRHQGPGEGALRQSHGNK